MDLDDSFTEKLLERMKARKTRKSILNREKTVLVEEQIPIEEVTGHMEYPKHLCEEQLPSEKEEKNHMEEIKENIYVVEEAPIRKRGLAALRKKHSDLDNLNDKRVLQDVQQLEKPLSYTVSTNSKEKCSSLKNRLANLAADINGWEDNLKQSAVSTSISAKTVPDRSEVQTIKVNVSKTDAQKTWNNVKEMGKEIERQKLDLKKETTLQTHLRAKEVEDTLNCSFEPSNLPLSVRKSIFEQGGLSNETQQKQQAIEIKLSVAQRAAMFENGPRYNFRSKPVSLSPTKTSQSSKVDKESPVKPTSRSPVKPVCRSSAIPHAEIIVSSTKPSAASIESPDRPSPPLSRGSLTKPLVTGATMSSKSIIINPPTKPLMFLNQLQWVKTTGTDPEMKQPLSTLISQWKNLSSLSKVGSNQSKEETSPYKPTTGTNASYSSDEEQDEQIESELEEHQVLSEYENQVLTEGEESDNVGYFTDISSFNSKKFAAAAGIETETENEDCNSVLDRYSDYDGSSCYSLSSSACRTTVGKDRTGHNPLSRTVSFCLEPKIDFYTPLPPNNVKPGQGTPFSAEEQGIIMDIQEEIKELKEKINDQDNIIAQTRQLFSFCCTKPELLSSTQEVEGVLYAEGVLLTATHRHQAYLNEIQRLKSHGAHKAVAGVGYGTLTITNLKLPLKRNFIISQLEGKTNDVHYFLCLVRHGHEVIKTQMVSTNDKIANGSLHLTNMIQLTNLPPDFSIVFEVFTMQIKKESESNYKKYGIRTDLSKSRLSFRGKKGERRVPAVSSAEAPDTVKTSNFSLVGYTHFTVQNCTKKCFTLNKVPFTSPLDGILKVKLQLHAEQNVSEQGFLTMFEDVSGFGAWVRRWCTLENHLLSYWKYPDEEYKKDAMGFIDLYQCITKEVCVVSRDFCARPHTFQLLEVRPRKKEDKDTLVSESHGALTTTKWLLSADTREERERWCQQLNNALRYVRLWNPKALALTQ